MALRNGGAVTASRTHSVDGTKRFKLLSLKGPVGVRHEDIWQRCTRYCVRGDEASSLRLRVTEEEDQQQSTARYGYGEIRRHWQLVGQHCHVTQAIP
jgi:hypothetical protein